MKISYILFRTRESLHERRKTKRSSFSSNPKRNTLALLGSAGSTVAGLATNEIIFDFAFSPLILPLKRAIRGKVSEGSLKKFIQDMEWVIGLANWDFTMYGKANWKKTRSLPDLACGFRCLICLYVTINLSGTIATLGQSWNRSQGGTGR